MAFTEIMGNRAVIDRLKDTIQQDHVFHAYIFEGQNGSERKSMAVNFIKGILCESKTGDACETCISCTKINHGNHEDLLMLEADGSGRNHDNEGAKQAFKDAGRAHGQKYHHTFNRQRWQTDKNNKLQMHIATHQLFRCPINDRGHE
jgi:DNA polymerase III delta prime subunit